MRVISGTMLLTVLLIELAGAGQYTQRSESSSTIPSRIAGKSLEEWKRELIHEDASRRTQAILSIMQFKEAASVCVPAIVDRLTDQDVCPRARALLALRTMSIEDKDVDRVVKAVSMRLVPRYESQAVIRYEALLTLHRFVTDGTPAIPNLMISTMDRSSFEIRRLAVGLLWRIGLSMGKEDSPPDQRIIETLLNSLRADKTYQVRLETIQGLGALGRPANPALLAKLISELKLCAVHPNKPLAIWAYCGLVAMQDGAPAELSLRTLCKFLASNDLETRVQAASALGALGEKAKSKVSLLLPMLNDKEPTASVAAATALGSIGDASDKIIDALLEVVENKDPYVAAGGVTALVNLKQNNRRVIGVFDKLRENKDLDRRLRYVIEEGMKEMKKPAKK